MSNSDPEQEALQSALRTACEVNYDSYKQAGMLHGRGEMEQPYTEQMRMSTI